MLHSITTAARARPRLAFTAAASPVPNAPRRICNSFQSAGSPQMNPNQQQSAAAHQSAPQDEPVNPNEVLPPDQAPDLLEDTALPISGLQEAFAKAYKWQQQQQEQPQQLEEEASNNHPVIDHAAAAKSGSTDDQDGTPGPGAQQQGTSVVHP